MGLEAGAARVLLDPPLGVPMMGYGLREGGAGTAIRDRLHAAASDAVVDVLGVPTEYIPHGDPGDILRGLGLDGAGIAATVRTNL